MDQLHSSGQLGGSLGAPSNGRRGQLSPGPRQLAAPVRTVSARPGLQLGATAVKLVRGAYFRNITTGAAPRSFGALGSMAKRATDSTGFPAAPTVTGWDGVPLDQYGVRDPDGYLLQPAPPPAAATPAAKGWRDLFIAWITPGVPPPGPLG